MLVAADAPSWLWQTLPGLAAAAVLTASLLNFLTFGAYPLLSPEVAMVLAGLLAGAMAFGLLYWLSGGLVRIVLDVALVYLALDLNFDGIGVAVAAFAAAILLNRHLMPVLAITFAVVMATELVQVWIAPGHASESTPRVEAGGAAKSELPAILHIILDEHIGPEGLADEHPGAGAARDALIAFYRSENFRLYGGAYSEYLHTINAIPQILNFGEEQPWAASHADGMHLTKNKYFELLRTRGYTIRVHQSEFIDFCSDAAVTSCTTRPSNDLAAIAEAPLSARDRAIVLMMNFWALSDFARVTTHLYDIAALRMASHGIEMPLLDFESSRKSSAISGLAAFDDLIADLRSAVRGEVYFAHILLPHYPYATRADCRLKEKRQWLARGSLTASLEERQSAYFEQLGCATRQVRQVLDALRESPAASNAVVIVHGDHGSRITGADPTVENLGRFGAADMIAGYSTLFAVRSPTLATGYDTMRAPVAALFGAFAKGGFQAMPDAVPTPSRAGIVLDDSNWRPIRRQNLPAEWISPKIEAIRD